MARRPSVFQHVHQNADALAGDFVDGLLDGRYPRHEKFAHLDAVKADDAHILRNVPPHVRQSADDAHCDGIGHAEDGGGVALHGEKGACSVVSALERKARLDETLILNGYNLYRNGELYKQLPATEGYTDTEIEKGNIYTYNVTAVFDKGESPYSNTVTVDRSQSGIDETSGNPIKVYAADHTIVIENVDNRQAEIFKIDGSKIFDEIISYKDRIRVETGIYIVRIDGKSFKVTVR